MTATATKSPTTPQALSALLRRCGWNNCHTNRRREGVRVGRATGGALRVTVDYDSTMASKHDAWLIAKDLRREGYSAEHVDRGTTVLVKPITPTNQ